MRTTTLTIEERTILAQLDSSDSSSALLELHELLIHTNETWAREAVQSLLTKMMQGDVDFTAERTKLLLPVDGRG